MGGENPPQKKTKKVVDFPATTCDTKRVRARAKTKGENGMFEDYDTYEFYENDLEEMGRNEAWEDAQAEMADIYDSDDFQDYPEDPGFELEDQHLDSMYESQYESYDYYGE